MNNNQNYRIVDGWIIDDDNGNMAQISYWWSESLAIESLKTLKNCRNCVNCVYCINCDNCKTCKCCVDCKNGWKLGYIN